MSCLVRFGISKFLMFHTVSSTYSFFFSLCVGGWGGWGWPFGVSFGLVWGSWSLPNAGCLLSSRPVIN